MITVLVVDDMRLIRRLLVQQLSREPDIWVAGEAEDGRQAVELCVSLSPDVVLMDLSMPKMNGVEAMERIRALRPRTKVILLSAHEELVSLGRLSGAAACLNKNCTPQELSAAIYRVATSVTPERPAGPATNGKGGDAETEPDLCATLERVTMRAGLTVREKAVLTQLVNTDDTVGQIAARLGSEMEMAVTEAAVRHTIERVMTKLAIHPRTRATLVKFILENRRTAGAASENYQADAERSSAR